MVPMTTTSAVLTDKELIGRLVGFDSTSARSNVPIADFVCEYLDGPSVEIVRQESADGSKVNVVARIGPDVGADRTGLILSGHLDVVPAIEPQWESDPFELIERDGAYVGRGACDMKGFNALAMNVFRSVDPAQLIAPLVLVFTCDEEVGSLGAKRLAMSWPNERPLPRQAVIGEPTSLRVVRMHKGHLTMRIIVRGRSAHSGSPHLGINAIEPAAGIIQGLIVLREKLAACRTATSEFFPEVPFPVLNVARIHGGEAINVVPEVCVIDIGVRLLPGEASDDAIHMVRSVVGSAGEVEVLNDNPPMLLSEDAPTHRILCDLVSQESSHGVSYASDAGWLSRMGIDCVLYGPGTIEVAHRPNESVPVAELRAAYDVLVKLVARTCMNAR